ncbi:histidine--tRNA ligase [Micavibrio aeruginosavorus]|uniref:Histidine--tRNA ligase n=1 Tax=Micavibrio aeruginosavorus (strain ARL-13) TaxID=856793 RepID=G2KNE3_MICAA|nr:histidine--tRNA ligase [Micavibrio aeruginosavorus]AEP09791.1 anticodon binding domain protein [Micavibrio aeruginosavorus ARL-13]
MSTDTKKQIYKPRPVTGFPEWLPEVRLVEQQWFDHIRRVFESYGFCSIETPSVEELDVLRAKGEVDKEIYVIERLHKDENDKSDARLALHFDQTVPLARYVAQNFNELVFPFKRYQMQRVWRGERPQAGRFREFYQCDIDVIGIDTLPLHFDAEMPAIMWEVMNGLPGMENEKIQMRISNRKILIGYLESIGINDKSLITIVTNAIDKIEKNGLEAFYTNMHQVFEETAFDTQEILIHLRDFGTLAARPYNNADELRDALERSRHINTSHPTIKTGIEELCAVLDSLADLPDGAVVADLAMVRGLDYYTGTVYETVFVDDPGYGSICSGGRYDDLAGSYINKNLPGVGISVGFSRLFARMVDQKKIDVSRKSPAHILLVMTAEERRGEIAKTAQILRARGFNVEMYHAAKKIPDQLKYASRKGIPFVWFAEEDGTHQVKNMSSGEQTKTDPQSWVLPEGYARHEAA